MLSMHQGVVIVEIMWNKNTRSPGVIAQPTQTSIFDQCMDIQIGPPWLILSTILAEYQNWQI